MKNPRIMVFCQNNDYGRLDFYLVVDGTELYLFTTNYFSRNIFEKYRNGQRFEQLFENTSQIRQQKLKERILRMTRYVAEENLISLSNKPKKPIRKRLDDYEYEVA